MFMGGADNRTDTELRPSSLKGLLRFWFRAVAWPQLGSLKKFLR
ncbi:type III-B CRISPR module RAMP protein Cmr1 [Caldanaerobacter subterraneus]